MTDFRCANLYQVTRLPLDKGAEIFHHYPAFKLGVRESVRHYAQLLLPLVEEFEGILTAPPIVARTPAGANLLSWELFDLSRRDVALFNLHYEGETTASSEYAKMSFTDRTSERERLSDRLPLHTVFRGRPVLFVNDISVSGAQQQAMQTYFENVGAASVTWLYLIFVDQELGRAHPDIEWQINFAPFNDLLQLVSRDDIQFTGKCVFRLLNLSVPELNQVLQKLTQPRRVQLYERALWNGLQNQPAIQEQLSLLSASLR